MLTKQTWAEKQEQSKKHESEMQRLRKATRDAAKRAESERRKRFQLLREKGDVELSVRELNLPSSWADQARRLDGLKARVGDRRAHLNVLRDALLSDLGCSHDDEDPVERARSAKAAADSAQGRLCGAASVFFAGRRGDGVVVATRGNAGLGHTRKRHAGNNSAASSTRCARGKHHYSKAPTH